MEKRVRTYDLEAIKLALASVNQLRMTNTALREVRLMGFS